METPKPEKWLLLILVQSVVQVLEDIESFAHMDHVVIILVFILRPILSKIRLQERLKVNWYVGKIITTCLQYNNFTRELWYSLSLLLTRGRILKTMNLSLWKTMLTVITILNCVELTLTIVLAQMSYSYSYLTLHECSQHCADINQWLVLIFICYLHMY